MSDDPAVREYCTANLVSWLRAKYKRHGELEDKYAADALESYALKLDHYKKTLKALEPQDDSPNHGEVAETGEKVDIVVALRAQSFRWASPAANEIERQRSQLISGKDSIKAAIALMDAGMGNSARQTLEEALK